jgi:hypothetical protein
MATQTELQAGFEALQALAEAIQTLGTVPSGELYAQIAGVMSLAAYDQAIGLLIRSTVITRSSGHVLRWNVAAS